MKKLQAASVVGFKCECPGRYVPVDHALSRVAHSLAGYLIVSGEADPEIYEPLPEGGGGMGH